MAWVLAHAANSRQVHPELGWSCTLGGPSKVQEAGGSDRHGAK